MKRTSRRLLIVLCMAFVGSLLMAPAIAGERVTIVGTVNDNYQIVTEDKETYFIGENLKGDQLVQLVDQKVRVTGVVEESDDEKVIRVTSYEVIGE